MTLTNVRALIVGGVKLISRDQIAEEYRRASALLSSLDSSIGRIVKSITVDSRAESFYEVKVKLPHIGWVLEDVAIYMDDKIRTLFGGHNGVVIDAGDIIVMREPFWVGDEL